MTPIWKETLFADVGEFVENYLTFVYQRQVTDTADSAWCPEWWQHVEAVSRLEALWRAWEHFQNDPDRGMIRWLEHADRHMANLLSPSGPFRFCGARHGHRQLLAPLPVTPPPPDRFMTVTESVCKTLDNFVGGYLGLVYQRQVTDTLDAAWCPEWWKHPEAVVRLDALWNSWEAGRYEGGFGLSFWFLEYADMHMAKLLDPRGPFQYCGIRSGHKDLLEPLPVVRTPAGLFSHPDYRRELAAPSRGV